MKKNFSISFVLAVLAISLSPTVSCAETVKTESAQHMADILFQQSLSADQAGDHALRDRLLEKSLQQDPNHKLARWHSGQLLHNGKWQPLETVERLVASDPRWQEYRDRVEAGEDTLKAHAALAKWCRKEGLKLEAEWHWFNALRHDSNNKEALGGLGLRPFRGDYLTTEQITDYEAAEEQAKRDFDHYADLLKSAMREAERSQGSERLAALNKISSIHEPAAIQAIVEVVLSDVKNERRILSKMSKEGGEKLLRQMQLSGIAALSDIPEHEATLRLLEVGLYASDAQVRTAGAKALRDREPTSFMPMLMAGLAAPIELSFTVSTLPNGQITVFEDLSEAGPLAKQKHTRSSTFLTQHVNIHTHDNTISDGRNGFGPTFRSTRVARVWSDQYRDMANATAQVTNTQDRVELENAIRQERNARIQQVMGLASGKELGEDPEAWWNDWKAYNEVSTPAVLPVNETEENFDYTQRSVERTYSQTLPVIERPPVEVRYSCFVAGTPVWTRTGRKPIETVRMGEFVLSQNPHTGELSYRPVISRMVTPQSSTVEFGMDKETIVTTRGHRFWVPSKGWQMAKSIKTGDQLFSATGNIDLQSAKRGVQADVYNLEVGEFHTYFVGQSRLLVHDNTCPQPTVNTLPGVSPRAEFAPQLAQRN